MISNFASKYSFCFSLNLYGFFAPLKAHPSSGKGDATLLPFLDTGLIFGIELALSFRIDAYFNFAKSSSVCFPKFWCKFLLIDAFPAKNVVGKHERILLGDRRVHQTLQILWGNFVPVR